MNEQPDASPRETKFFPPLSVISGDGRRGSTRDGTAELRRLQKSLALWYQDMTPSWRSVEPPLRRRLVLRTHQWIVESVFGEDGTPTGTIEDLGPGGRLASALAELVPASEVLYWRPWIRLALHDLRRALRWPPSRRTEAWCRWLFLIPYSLPVRTPPPKDPLDLSVS
jgi:hypothetical protein